MSETKVIIPKLAGHDFGAAAEYGEIIELLPGRISPFNIDMLKRKIKARMDEVGVGPEDLLCMSGPAILNCLVFHEWQRAWGKVELLLFHSRDLEYIHRTWIKDDDEKSPRDSRRD